MDEHWFDRLARSLAIHSSRRQALKLLAGTALGGWLARAGDGLSQEWVGRAAAGQVAAAPATCSTLMYYENCPSNIRLDHVTAGQVGIQIDSQFAPAMQQICQCAQQSSVVVSVTSSYRFPGTTPAGAVVPPAANSNHHAGHAIDMNVYFSDANGSQQLCNSDCLCLLGPCAGPLTSDEQTAWAPVAAFIQCIRDSGLRWGGDFQGRGADPVHIDDGLNIRDKNAWKDRVQATGAQATCDPCQTCNPTTGQCEQQDSGGHPTGEFCVDTCCRADQACCFAGDQRHLCCNAGDTCCDAHCCSPGEGCCADPQGANGGRTCISPARLLVDPGNCGGCGIQCGPHQGCIGGKCR